MIDRAVDAWGARSALARKAARALSHVAIAATYALAYLALRETSNDQWYLPAGLRFVMLLITPTRYWPALYAGDIVALGLFRIPMIPSDGIAWVTASVFPVWPAVAAVVYQLRKKSALPHIRTAMDAGWFVIAALIAAELPSFLNKACSALLRHSAGAMKFSDLFVYTMGHLQGILLFSFVAICIFGKCVDPRRERMLRIEAGVTIVLSLILAAAISAATTTSADTNLVQGMRMLLLVPAVAMSVRFGYRGACVGAVASNVALFLTIPHQDAGLSDPGALVMQEAFALIACSMFVLGARIYERMHEATGASNAERAARHLAKASFDSSESLMRERAIRAEELQTSSRTAMQSTIKWLRAQGHSEVAMGLVGIAHSQAAAFQQIIVDALYPLTLERDGLYAALNSEAFHLQFDMASVECNLDLLGSAQDLPIATQRAVYRVIGESVDYLLASIPTSMQIRVRCTTRNGRGHVSIALYARDPAVTTRSSVDTARLAGLRTRALAYEGSFHNKPHRIRVILLDEAMERHGIPTLRGHVTRRAQRAQKEKAP
jgi:glucose-6-phosphate-specific signal transduction histidine kinase